MHSFLFRALRLHQPNTFQYKILQNFNTLQNQIIFKKNLFTSNSLFSNKSIITNSTKELTEDINIKENNEERQRIEIELNERDLLESFVKGSGNGGQKINTTSNCVNLKHIPTGIRIQCQKTRSLQQNRNIARKILIEKLDNYYNDELSKSSLKREKIRKKQSKRRKRTKEKYGDKSKVVEGNEDIINNMEDLINENKQN